MRMLDLFSGIGGFHKGFEQAGYEFDWVGFSEIDKYASAVYRHRFPKAEELGDITTIQPERDLPDHIDIICGGFPCQAFSVAGKRKGFDDTRGTLFFEIARILRHYRDAESPIDYFLLENVKGLLSHDNGRTFATIYGVLSDLGYTVEFQLLNTRWWLPQNRERIYLVGYIGDRSGSKVFPIGEDGGTYNVNQTRTKSKTKLFTAITTREGGRKENNFVIVDKQSDMQIRRLTPVECCRLQGFPDDWNEYGEFDGEVKPMSDTQRYKQCGNAVTVNVVQAVAERIASPKVQSNKKG